MLFAPTPAPCPIRKISRRLRTLLACIAVLAGFLALRAESNDAGLIAAKPLFRDPVYDGAADPTVIWNIQQKKWVMFYTNRRSTLATSNINDRKWIHGTQIGMAESLDEGATWKYVGVAKINYGEADYTQWAPEVVHDGTIYHMFLTIVPGTFESWDHPRSIVHLTSPDLGEWKYQATLKLSSDRVIDPCIQRLADGTWRLWYNNEGDKKTIYYADSRDLSDWQDQGKVKGVGDRPGEGPQVFQWRGSYWMLVDVWKGLGVYKSADATNWTKQETNLLVRPGTGLDDNDHGRHADVVVSGNRAFLFYFTHPGMTNPAARTDAHERTRSTIQVVELREKGGVLSCDRNADTLIKLVP